ncbi:hypothetical protein D3C72_2089340 [compost metagenome]
MRHCVSHFNLQGVASRLNLGQAISECLRARDLVTEERHELDHVLLILQYFDLLISQRGQHWERHFFVGCVEIFQ